MLQKFFCDKVQILALALSRIHKPEEGHRGKQEAYL
jgi:hypothetical protein